MRTLSIGILALLTWPCVAHAGAFQSGNQLYEKCAASERDPNYSQKFASCQGFVMAVLDTVDAVGSVTTALKGTYCVPDSVTTGQLVAVVTRFFEARPEQRHLSAASLVIVAIQQGFPCTKK
jgi:hypothetical protein